ncbi:DUF2997 domain-containing protein [Hazenella coriacea]|uniref:DUF2997 family protein n=1 Tax=Hazenella coriacea TaxID=1179467 RepID=A0A4V2UVP6_9BACL|nr:DUF2997 domain-containing protein [Hazenella coriacea]TCS96607.1 DUF2997 family protein [Hazenella coriacea]
MNQKVTIQIQRDGKIAAHIEGIKGKKCTEYIRILEQLLEAETFDSNYTSEYFEAEELNSDRIKQQQTLKE